MPWGPFLILLVVQGAIAAIVVFVLLRLLDKELFHAALEKVQGYRPSDKPSKIDVRHGPSFHSQRRFQVESLCKRKFSGVPLNFQEDSALKGGVVIVMGQEEFDYSVAGRLRNFWSV